MTNKKSSNFLWLLCCTLILSNSEGFTQQSARPEPKAAPAAIAAPRDIPYAGTIRLTVDATDIDRHIFIVRESIPVRGGDSLVLFYPQWLPGNHSPTGRIDKLAGLTIRANGMPVEWRRDTVNVFAFHVAVPANVTALDAEFQYLSPVDTDEGRIVMTPEMLNLQWNAVGLYPAGYFTRQIMVEPSVRLPDNWQFATALEVLWEGPAFQKGLTVGTQIVAVDGIAYTIDRLKAAIRETQKTRASIELLVKNGDHYRTVRMEYHDGLRYPHLERTGAMAFLDQILAPR